MNFDLQYDYAEALRHQKRTQSDVDATRKLVNVHEVVPKTITDKQLLLFLDSCGNPEEAARVTNIYYSMRKSNPEHFDNRNPLSSEIQQCLQHQEYFHLPNLPNGDHLIFHGVSNPKASDYIYDDAVKTYFMAIDSCLNKMGPRDGVVFLFDMKNVGLMHLTRASLKSIQKEMAYFQEGMPTKLREVHVLNATFFIDKVLMILKPFLKAGILKKIHVHPSNMDFEKFYENFVPKSCLPSDYGGDLDSVEELHKQHTEEFLTLENHFIEEEKQAKLLIDS